MHNALVAVLALEDDIEVVATLAAGNEIVPSALEHRPDVALIDIDLPGVDGLTAAADLHARLPECRVLILTGLAQPGNLRRAVATHVAGFLSKDVPSLELIEAVRRVAAGERVVDQELALAALDLADNPLSPREAEILKRYAAGADANEIAARHVPFVRHRPQLPGGGRHQARRAQPHGRRTHRDRGGLAIARRGTAWPAASARGRATPRRSALRAR